MKKTSSDLVFGVYVDFLNDPAQFEFWYNKMPGYRKEKIDAIKAPGSRLLSLGAGIVMHKGAEIFGINDDEVDVYENGKPYLKGTDNVMFNLSHSGSLAVGAFSDKLVGIDVETIKNFSQRLTNYVYNQDEITYIKYRSENEDEENRMYTKLWTMKESVMKYYGRGLAMDPRKLFIDQEGDCQVYYDGEKTDQVFFTGYEQNGYCITVCSPKKNFLDEIQVYEGV